MYIIIYYGNNELKLYIMVGTTIRAALAKGTIVCILFSLPFVCHCLQYFSTTLGRVIRCTKVRWVDGVQRVVVVGRTNKPPFPFPSKCFYLSRLIKLEREWSGERKTNKIYDQHRGNIHSSQGKVSLKQDSPGALQDTMNQGGNLRYFPQLDPGLVKYIRGLMTL